MSINDFSIEQEEQKQAQQKAWVVFSGKADLPWLKILKPGFRHCFVLLNDGERWLSMEPLLNHMELKIHHNVPADFDLPRWFQMRGQTVVRGHVDHSHTKCAPWMLFTCVEAVKRVLGLHERFVITPWQLYRRLKALEHQRWKNARQKAPAGAVFRTSSKGKRNKGELSWEV